jgi:phage recombination protein Bet
MSNGIVQYQASDGTEVKLSPAIVTKYILTGSGTVPDGEVFSFLAKCQARRLNPLAGDAYMTCFGGKASVIVSKDYFIRTATQQPGFDGFRAGIVVVGRDGSMTYREGCIYGKQTERLVGGWAEVYDKGRRIASRAEVSLDEYDQHRSLWKTKPATMIRKVALVQALREAYPGSYGGLYDRDEMPEPDMPVEPPAPEPQPVEAVAEPLPDMPEPEAHEQPADEQPMSIDEFKEEYGAVEVTQDALDF